MLSKYLFKIISIVIVLALGNQAAHAFEDIDFPAVVQGHNKGNSSDDLNCTGNDNDAKLEITNDGRINGTNGESLNFCDSDTSSSSCDTAADGNRECSVTGKASRGLDLSAVENQFLEAEGSVDDYQCSKDPSLTIGSATENQFGSIKISKSCELNLSDIAKEYRIDELKLSNNAIAYFPAGDYWIGELSMSNKAKIYTQSDVNIFVNNSLKLSNYVVVNPDDSSNFQLVSYDDVKLSNEATIFGNVYANDEITLSNYSAINGRVKSHVLTIKNDGVITAQFDPEPPVAEEFKLEFGKAKSGSVDFDSAFPDGVTPLIFLMPTISSTVPSSDGPASAFVTSVSSTGFTWSQQEPESDPDVDRYIQSQAMEEVHWIAVTQGEHELSDGTKIAAGLSSVNQFQIGGTDNSKYVDVAYADNNFDVVLSQTQLSVNDCWLTSLAEADDPNVSVSMEVAEVYSGDRCQPADLATLADESVAYLAVSSGTGQFNHNGKNIRYQFGTARNRLTGNTLLEQCNSLDVNFEDSEGDQIFNSAPTFVAGKMTRNGANGGWLRRCQLTKDQASVVVDEDTYRDSDRNHTYETYGYVAFEEIEPIEVCFTDDFENGTLGDDWTTSDNNNGFTPGIYDGRLRLTTNSGNLATSTTYKNTFSAKDSIVTIEFDLYAYDGSGADGVAVVLSDATVSVSPGAYGGPLGYGARSYVDGFAGGWLGIGLDEFGNFSAEGSVGDDSYNIGNRKQSVAIRGSGSERTGYRYLRGTCDNGTTNTSGDCLSPGIDGNSGEVHRYRVTVDSSVEGQSVVKVERKTPSDTGYVTLIDEFDAAAESGQADVPENFWLSLTGSTGGANNIHEIDNFEVCSIDTKPPVAEVHHFEFEYSSTPLTCRAEEVTIKACLDVTCQNLYNGTLTADLSPVSMSTGGWVGSNEVIFDQGVATAQLRSNTTADVTIGIESSDPVAANSPLCSRGGAKADTASCTMSYATSGFDFDVPNKWSNQPEAGIVFRAVKQDEVTELCVPEFVGETKSIGFWSLYVTPDSSGRVASLQASVNDVDIVNNDTDSPTQVDVTFDDTGDGIITVNYPDAGELSLNASYLGADDTDEEELVMTGSDSFISTPVGICVTPETVCTVGDATCPVFRKTNEDFDINLQAKAWQQDSDSDYCDNINTPSYEQDSIVLSTTLVAPADGVNGALNNLSYDHGAQVDNINTIRRNIDEVGVFTVTANPPQNYLDSGFNVAAGTSDNIGRFIPYDYDVSAHSVVDACSISGNSYTYMDQAFSMMATISARNQTGNVTQNYRDLFAKGTLKLAAQDNNAGPELTTRLSGDSNWDGVNREFSLAWNAGSVTVSKNLNFARLTTGTADGPFNQLDVGLWLDDQETSTRRTEVGDADMNAATSDDCSASGTCAAVKLPNSLVMRQGRIVADNTYGPQSAQLAMPVRAEYWGGSGWVQNTDDSCSALGVADLPTPYANDSSLGYNYLDLPTGDQGITRTNDVGAFDMGEFQLLWRAILTPSSSTDPLYSGQVTAPIQVPTWLTWYWNWDGSSSTTFDNPRASAFFGTYRGHDRIIYWREVN